MYQFMFLLLFFLWNQGISIADTISATDKGKELYLLYGCALCHGRSGDGHGINSQNFDPPPTNFHNSQAYHHGTDWDSLRRSIQYGIKDDNSVMPSFEHIPPEELNQIISYLQSLQKKE